MMMDDVLPLPLQLEEILLEAGLRDVPGWWNRMDDPSREQVRMLWEDCMELNGPQPVKLEVRAHFDKEDSDYGAFWQEELWEYLINHELEFYEGPKFHVCSQHPLARQALKTGKVRADFQCALDPEVCPMMLMLRARPRCGVRLEAAFRVVE